MIDSSLHLPLSFAVVAVILACLAGWFSSRIARASGEAGGAAIADGISHFIRGDLDYRIATPSGREYRALAESLNKMAATLDQREHQRAAAAQEQDAILRSMIEGVITIDSEQRVRRLNQVAVDLLGVTRLEWLNHPVTEVIRHAELQKFIRDSLAASSVTTSTITVSGSDSKIFLEVTASPLKGEDESPEGILLVLHDISQLRKLEEIRSDFVANVSHELKTPITSIKGFVETLLDGAMHEPESLQKFLEIIARQSDRLVAILEDLLTLSRLEVGGQSSSIEVFDTKMLGVLQGAVEGCVSSAKAKKIQISIECDSEVSGMISPSLVEQAVVNLLDNAIKHSGEDGNVILKGRIVGDMIRIEVEDDGVGIDKPHLSRLFERFYRIDQGRSRKAGGTGLGLAIVKHIAQAHRGSIEVESELGKGAKFSLILPRTEASR